jgi:hypothetical protein
VACGGETGQQPVSIPLHVAGSETNEPLLGANGVTLDIERALLAFGPLVLCAGRQAGDACETARLEWLGSTVIDVMDPEPKRAGVLVGVSGHVASWMYDLGITSQLSDPEPHFLEAAAELGGHSLVIEGVAHVGEAPVPFAARVIVAQGDQGERGLPIVRKSQTDDFEHDVTDKDTGLLIRFDPTQWLAGVDFSRLVVEPEQGCSGSECGQSATITPPSQAYNSIRNALQVGARPRFEWRQ